MPSVPPPFHFDRTWDFPVTPAVFWSTIARTDDYTSWWSWLRDFDEMGGFREDIRSKILHENAARLLGIDP